MPLTLRPALIPPDAHAPIHGLWVWDVPGIRVWAPFVSADVCKDSDDWWEASREGMPLNEHAREIGMDFTVFAGKPVYPEYQDRFHLWPAAKGPLRYLATRPIVRGWDMPGTLACVWMQLVPVQRPAATKTEDPLVRLHILAELMADVSVVEFGRQVQSVSSQQFPQATQYIDWADPAAWAKERNDLVSCREKLKRECGIHLFPGPVAWLDRLEPVRHWLMGLTPGVAMSEPPGRLLLDWSCTRLQQGFKSAYHYGEVERGGGRYKDLPEKNWASHLLNALEYAVARLDRAAGTEAKVEALTFENYLGRMR